MAALSEGSGVEAAKKKKPPVVLTRDVVIKRLNKRNGEQKKPSPLAQLQEIFEEAADKSRFVGDTMFWKYYEDIDISRIYHTNSVEYMNLKVMFWETVFYVVLVIFFTTYVYVLQSRDVFDARQEQQMYWAGCDASDQNCLINKVVDMTSFWSFLKEDFVTRAFTEYKDPPQQVAAIKTTFPSNDFWLVWNPRFVGPQKSNIVLGTVRMRQLRVTKNMGCKVSKLVSHIYPDCYGPYAPEFESSTSYAPRFTPTYLRSAYDFAPASKTVQAPVSGTLADYGGEGFMFDLPWNATDSRTMLGDLWEWSWLDRATRAVVVELSTLNTNVNVIINTRILFEFSPSGAVSGQVVSTGARAVYFTPSASNDDARTVLGIQFVLFAIFILFATYACWLMYKTCKNFIGEHPIRFLRKQNCSGKIGFFFKTFYSYVRYAWNCVDLVIILLYFMHVGFRFRTYSATYAYEELAPDMIGHPERFMPFSLVLSEVVYGNNLLSLLAILVWFKLFKYFSMSSYFRILVRILERCAEKLVVFSALLICVFFGFAVAFFAGFVQTEESYSFVFGSFLVGWFQLIDGYNVNKEWFYPGRDWIMPLVFFIYIALIYFVMMNVAVAIVLDVYATVDRGSGQGANAQNPMVVFLYTYWKMMLGISLVRDDTEENMKSEDLSIPLELLPGVVRRKWVEKKRKMQRIANESFAGMELYPVDLDSDAKLAHGRSTIDWMMPSSRQDVFGHLATGEKRHLSIYDVPQALLKSEISRAQLQRLMDEDETLPILLQEARAEKVIRRFKGGLRDDEAEAEAATVQRLQGQVFGAVDALERVKLDAEIPEVPEISELTEDMSDAITTVRNQFRIQLTGIIEATAVLFEHLVELTQGIDAVRHNNELVTEKMRENAGLTNDAGSYGRKPGARR